MSERPKKLSELPTFEEIEAEAVRRLLARLEATPREELVTLAEHLRRRRAELEAEDAQKAPPAPLDDE